MIKDRNKKLKIVSLLLAVNSFCFGVSDVFAYERANSDFYEVLNSIKGYIDANVDQYNKLDKKKSMIITAKNVNLDSEDKYQELHDKLLQFFPEERFVDIYVTSNGRVFIPDTNIDIKTDDESKYNDNDKKFKTEIAKLGVKNLLVKNDACEMTVSDYNNIMLSICDIYNKYLVITDKHINHVYNTLFDTLSVEEIAKEEMAVGEYEVLEHKITLSPKIFNVKDQNARDKYIEYTVKHEMGHGIEKLLCRKVFLDLNLQNISKQDIFELADLYFSSQENKFSHQIIQKVLDRLGAPNDQFSRREYLKNNLSEYSQNLGEAFAEAIAFGNTRNEQGRNNTIAPLLDEEIKNIIDCKGEVYESLKNMAIKFLTANGVPV